jgi:glutamate/tyrosine decarboxylase-like PLP-dependent enzyme
MSPRAVFPAPRAGPPLLAPTGIGFAASSVTQSATVDAHKQIHLPTRTSLLVLGDPHDARAIEKSSDYIIRNGSDDLGQRSIESSRPGSPLFLHAALNIIGRRGTKHSSTTVWRVRRS